MNFANVVTMTMPKTGTKIFMAPEYVDRIGRQISQFSRLKQAFFQNNGIALEPKISDVVHSVGLLANMSLILAEKQDDVVCDTAYTAEALEYFKEYAEKMVSKGKACSRDVTKEESMIYIGEFTGEHVYLEPMFVKEALALTVDSYATACDFVEEFAVSDFEVFTTKDDSTLSLLVEMSLALALKGGKNNPSEAYKQAVSKELNLFVMASVARYMEENGVDLDELAEETQMASSSEFALKSATLH